MSAPANAVRRSAWKLGLVVCAMFGFGFALVPLYDMLCDAIGLNGKVKMEAAAVAGQVDRSRTVTVEFITTVNAGAPWAFGAQQQKVQLHPGEFVKVGFTAKSLRDTVSVAQAVPQVAPWNAARYVRKSECFCFNNQAFAPGEEKQMPVVLTVDPELPADVDTVTLSYTFFDVTELAQKADAKPRS